MLLYRSSCLGEQHPKATTVGKATNLLLEMNRCTSTPGPYVVPKGTLEMIGVWRQEDAELCSEVRSREDVQCMRDMHVKSFEILVDFAASRV